MKKASSFRHPQTRAKQTKPGAASDTDIRQMQMQGGAPEVTSTSRLSHASARGSRPARMRRPSRSQLMKKEPPPPTEQEATAELAEESPEDSSEESPEESPSVSPTVSVSDFMIKE